VGVDPVAHATHFEVQVDDAHAARVAHVPDDRTVRETAPVGRKAVGRSIEVAVEHDVIAQAATFAKRVPRHDARAEELAGEDDLGVALLVLERDDVHLGAARRGEIDAAVPDVRKLMAVALLVLGQIEVVSTHRELRAGARGHRVAVGAVLGGAIGAARDLVVRAELAALVVVRAAESLELVAARVFVRRKGHAYVAIRETALGAHGGEPPGAIPFHLQRRIGSRAGRTHLGPAPEGRDDQNDGQGANQRVHLAMEYDTSCFMAPPQKDAIETVLAELFQAQRKARKLAEEIAKGPAEVVLPVLVEAIGAARELKREEDRLLELESVAQILGQLPGPRAVDALIDILGSEESGARHAAGMVLEEVAYERFKEVALGIERALENLPSDHPALTELPYMLVEIPEPGVLKLVHRFFDHPNEEVVAAAIEAAVELGDPASIQKLAKLEKDTRLVEMDEEDAEDGAEASVTIGELAKEARLMLETLGPEETS
jgi:HEAT repeat protein